MTLTDEIAAFNKNLNRMARRHVKVQTVWVKVKSVDWAKKTMVATGVVDELDFNDVLLGLDSFYRKPVVDTLCLIGIIENHAAASFLILATELEETIYNGGGNGGIPISGKIDNNLRQLEDYAKALKDATRVALTALESVAGGPGSLTTAFDASMLLVPINFLNMENNKIKH